MRFCDVTFASPAENLACDEALLDACDEHAETEVLRFWAPADYFVVVGYANKVASEVNVKYCQENRIPIFRRCSGGGTVLQGLGCLNYSLILRLENSGPLSGIHSTNHFILGRNKEALAGVVNTSIQLQGDTDLSLNGRKFSGNSQRRKRCALLFHGCFLLHLDISLVEQVLPMPSREPAYRMGRSHADFVRNLQTDPEELKRALREIWCAADILQELPLERTATLLREKYSKDEWNFKF